MTMISSARRGQANDGFEAYFYHKLRAWVPQIYHDLDEDQSFARLLEIIASEAAQMRRDIDQSHANAMIESIDDPFIHKLGALVGAFPLSTYNRRASRAFIANMNRYLRRKGTLGVLDRLIADIAGREGYVRETWPYIFRTPHNLDMSHLRQFPLSQGTHGGLPELSRMRVLDAKLPSFEEFSHLPDFRPKVNEDVCFDLNILQFMIFAVQSYRIELATPFWFDDQRATLDPSGRDIALYHSASFDHIAGRTPIGPEEFPLPLSCARFNTVEFEITQKALDGLNHAAITAALRNWIGIRFKSKARFLQLLEDMLAPADFTQFADELIEVAMVEDCPKARQWDQDLLFNIHTNIKPQTLLISEIAAANLENWNAALFPDYGYELLFSSQGRIRLNAPLSGGRKFAPRFHHLGVYHHVGAGTYPRGEYLTDEPVSDAGPSPIVDANKEVSLALPSNGNLRFRDNRRYVVTNAGRKVMVDGWLRLEADAHCRPYVLIRADEDQLDFTFTGKAGQENHLVIDGLWLGMLGNQPIRPTPTAPIKHARIVIDGDFETVTLRNVTIDPGGEQARLDLGQARLIPAIRLEIEGSIKRLELDRTITGAIIETRNDISLLNAGEISIENSIIHSLDPETPALDIALGMVTLYNTTISGDVFANEIFATNTLFAGAIVATDTQNSCLRYCGFSLQPESKFTNALPRQFECSAVDSPLDGRDFHSARFGDAHYFVLKASAPAALHNRAEKGGEIGVGHMRHDYARRQDLQNVVSQFLPINQAAHIYDHKEVHHEG